MQLGVDEVLKLAPDDASAKAAKGLVVPKQWPRLGYDENAIWGECQGSGSKPYQVQVDKVGPAFRCTCPSRKFPCKHGLALLLLLAQNPGNFVAGDAPAWVAEWLASRRQRAEKQGQKNSDSAGEASAPVDPEASARREMARLGRMGEGLSDLERWLADRLRQGLAQLPTQSEIWEEMAVRMVDAQLPGMASRLRRARDLVSRGENWPARVLARLGEMQLLVEAFRHIQSLPAPMQADVRSALGVALDRDSVLAGGEQLADEWLVLGQSIEEEERLWVRRVWLWGGHTGRTALLLDFAHGSRRFDRVYVTATRQRMTLSFFPGNSPLRALPRDDAESPVAAAAPAATLDEAFDALSQRVAANPWQLHQPLLVSDGVPRGSACGWSLQTAGGKQLALDVTGEDGWVLVAESGGRPLTLFGEWDGETLRPLSCWNPGLVWSREVEAA